MKILFQITQICSNFLAAWSSKKRNIIIFKILSSISAVLMMICANQIIGAIPVAFTAIRTTIFMFKDKYKSDLPLWICIGIYILLAIFSVQTFMDILPTITSISASFILWYCKPIGIKIGLSLTDSIWAIYYFITELYLSCTYTIISIIISIISIIKIKYTESKKLN